MDVKALQELAKNLADAVEAQRVGAEQIKEAAEFKANKAKLLAEFAAKQHELQDLTDTFNKVKSEYAVWKRTSQESKTATIAAISKEVDAARESSRSEYEKFNTELHDQKAALEKEIVELTGERDEAKVEKAKIEKALANLKSRFAG
jgi:chromosome segregation ATPase